MASTSNDAKDSEKKEISAVNQSPAKASNSAKTEVTEDTAMEEDNENGKPKNLAVSTDQFWWQSVSFSRTN